MTKFKDISGQKFGRLTALYVYEEKRKSGDKVRWVCECDCGNPIKSIVTGTHLRRGTVISCGCYKKELVRNLGIKNKKSNIFIEKENSGLCYSPDGNKFLFEFDWEDLNLISGFCWSIGTRKYIHSRMKKDNGKVILLQLHRLILSNFYNIDYKTLKRVDHIDGNPQNNKKINLRLVTHSQNMMNRKLNKNNKTGIKGVEIRGDKFVVSITVNNVVKNLGSYSNIEDARMARVDAENKYFGEYARKDVGLENVQIQ